MTDLSASRPISSVMRARSMATVDHREWGWRTARGSSAGLIRWSGPLWKTRRTSSAEQRGFGPGAEILVGTATMFWKPDLAPWSRCLALPLEAHQVDIFLLSEFEFDKYTYWT